MAERPQKPQIVDIELFKGKSLRMGKVQGKIYAGIVSFKEADPQYPVVFLGQKSYCITDLKTKRTVLFYDTLSKALFRPKEMSNEEDSVDMVAQASQNVIIGGREAAHALGLNETTNTLGLVVIAAIIVVGIITMVFLYLIVTHAPSGQVATTTIIANGIKATTTIPNIGGTNIVPVSS